MADGHGTPETSLLLRHIASNVASREECSFATIRNTQSDRQGAYWPEDVIAEAGKVEDIGHLYVDFFDEKRKRIERIALLDARTAEKKPQRKPATRGSGRRSKRSEPVAAMDDGIKQASNVTVAVTRRGKPVTLHYDGR